MLKFKRCPCCQEIKPIAEFYKNKQAKNGLSSWCKLCCKKYTQSDKYKQYRQSEKGKLVAKKAHKKYHQSEKGKLAVRESNKKYQQTEKYRQRHKQYCQSDNGKKAIAKCNAKRKRNLNWIELYSNPFTSNIKIHWHHINNTYVVALPQWLHMLHYEKYHRVELLPLVLQIYPNLLEMLSNKLNNKQK